MTHKSVLNYLQLEHIKEMDLDFHINTFIIYNYGIPHCQKRFIYLSFILNQSTKHMSPDTYVALMCHIICSIVFTHFFYPPVNMYSAGSAFHQVGIINIIT